MRWHRFAVLVVFTLLFIVSISMSKHPDCDVAVPASAGAIAAAETLTAKSTIAPAYRWRNVAIEGMGFVTGIAIHPTQRNLVYVRTDIGGVYRWNEAERRWIPLMDQFGRSQGHYYGIESIALDPKDSNMIYAAVGMNTDQKNSEILKSRDQGRTWTATKLRTPNGTHVRMGANEEWRWAGERLAVDPNNSQIVYFGSRLDGLFRSSNAADTWQPVTSFPKLDPNKGGIAFVVFDARSRGFKNRPLSQTIYVGVMGHGVYRSRDGGTTWTLITQSPNLNPQQAWVAPDGTLYVTFFSGAPNAKGGVWKYVGDRWTNITPNADRNYSAIAGDPGRANTMMVAEYPISPDGLYRTTNSGKNWQRIRLNVKAVKWYPDWHLYTLMGGLAIDPFRPSRVWLTTGFGVMRTEEITANSSTWCTQMRNLEESLVFVIKSLPTRTGTVLLSGIADMDGFRHASLTEVPEQTHDRGKFGDTTGIDFSEANPNFVVRVGSFPGEGGREDSRVRSAVSRDAGRTWQPFVNLPPGAVNGKVAVSATLQPNRLPIIVWAPQGEVYPVRSLDGGKTWQAVRNAPNETTVQLWFSSQALASDRVDGNLFYLYKYGDPVNYGLFYRSLDGGATWKVSASNLPDSHLHVVKALPGKRGEVWLGTNNNLLYRSTDAGSSFSAIAQVQKADQFTFGKAAPGRKNPTLFVYGIVNGVEGLFRSDDATALSGKAVGATWVKVSTKEQALSNVMYLEGDPKIYGRVYVGTSGRGIFYGEPG